MIKFDILDAARYLKMYDWYIKNHPNINFMESISPNQIKSKIWLTDELSMIPILNSKDLTIEIVGSWFGWPLVHMLMDRFEIKKIYLFDIDPIACKVANHFAQIFEIDKKKITIINDDYWKHTNRKSNADLVINCSSEHMKETFYQNYIYSKECIFAIQSNNLFDEPTHINCCENEKELIKKHKFTKIMYQGRQKFNDFQFKKDIQRFMVIGKI